MKVLLVPLGSRGDVQPQLVLAEELVRRGHAVRVGAPPDFEASLKARGFPCFPVGQAIAEFLHRNRGMTEQNPLRALPAQIGLLRQHLRQSARDLFAVEHDADIVVAAGLSFCAKVLADKLRVPHVFCTYSLSAVYSAEHPPPVAPLFGLPRLGNQALWFALLAALDLAMSGILNDTRREHGVEKHRGSWLRALASQSLLLQDSVMGELPSDAPSGCVHLPAIVPRPEAAQPLSDLLERFLRGAGEGSSSAASVVYLGFGSMPSVDRAGVLRIARELFEDHGTRVILYAPGEQPSAELPPGVFVTGDTDHQSLFPRVDLIVHHGGAGTTAAALRSGVPQLVVPHIVDQFFHGRRIAELGLGPAPVAKAAFDTPVVVAALKDRFKYWAKAQSIRAQVNPAGGATAAADYLERLVASHSLTS